MTAYGQGESTDHGGGWRSYGDGFAVHDPLGQTDPAATLRAELAVLETRLRDLQSLYAAKRAQLDRFEAGRGVS